MWKHIVLLHSLLWLPLHCALQPGFSRRGTGKSTSRLAESSDSHRPSRWRRVLAFGGRSSSRQFDPFANSGISWFSAVPSDPSNDTVSSNSSVDSSAQLRREAEEFQRRARELMEEARIMEVELTKTRSSTLKKREESTGELIERMFLNRPLTPEASAQVMRDEKWTPEEAQMVLDGLFSQAYGTWSNEIIVSTETTGNSATSTSTTPSNSAADSSAATDSVQTFNATETLLLEAKMDCLINAAEILDQIAMASKDSVRRWQGRVGSALRARRNELRRAHEQNLARQIAVYQGANPDNTSGISEPYRTMGLMEDQGQWPARTTGKNVSQSGEPAVTVVPLWLPSSLLRFLAASPSHIDASDITTIKEKVLSGTAFFCTSTESIVQAAIFRGNIRGIVATDRNATAGVLTEIQRRLSEEGLAERLQVFLLPDPEWRQNRDQTVAQEPPKPVILAIPADVVPDERRLQQKTTLTGKALKMTAATIPILTTFVYSLSCYALNPKFFDAVMKQRNFAVLSACLPVFVGVFAVQVVHELAHVAVARRRGIKIGLPFPLPSFQTGMFGCITPLRSFPMNRSALLDFALSGPMSAMLVSIGMMIAGIKLTLRASGTDILRFPVVPVACLKSSFLTGSLLTIFAPKSMVLPLSYPLPLHPLFVVGFVGLLSSALNMLPVFRLDGGRACSAAMGSRFCAVASSGSLLFMFSLALSSTTGVAFWWGAFILFFQRRFEIPVRDEFTDVDDVRLLGWFGSLTTALLALAPFPGGPCFM